MNLLKLETNYKYKQLADHFRNRIRSGKLKVGHKFPSERKLAQDLSIDFKTANKAVSLLVAENLLYRIPGKGTFVNEKVDLKVLGAVIPVAAMKVWSRMMEEIEHRSRACGYRVSIRAYHFERDDQELQSLKAAGQESVGMIVYPGWNSANADYLLQLRKEEYPFVLVDLYLDGLGADSITTDNLHGGYLAARHLLELGHRRFGLIGVSNVSSIRERVDGCKRALEEDGIGLDQSRIVSKESISQDMSSEVEELLAMRDRPSALFILEPMCLNSCMQAIQKKRLNIPEDIALVVFDDIEGSAYFHPPLTTVRQPMEAIGRKAVDILVARVKGNKQNFKKIRLKPELIVRESCGSRLLTLEKASKAGASASADPLWRNEPASVR